MNRYLHVLAMVALGLAAPLLATESDAQSELTKLLTNLNNEKSASRLIPPLIGFLRPGATRDIPLPDLEAGRSYLFVVAGCRDALDIDLGVLDATGQALVFDNEVDRAASVRFTPKEPGRYLLRVRMANATADGAHFALVALGPPAAARPVEAAPKPKKPSKP